MLIKIRNLNILFFSFVFLLMINCKDKPNLQHEKIVLPKINFWESQPSSSLPFEFKYHPDSIMDFFYTIENYKSTGKIAAQNSFNTLFSDATLFRVSDDLMAKDENGYPYKGNAYFFKKLPDFHNHKIMLFTYENSNQEYYLPYMELQTFDKDKLLIDKMIVAGGFAKDCSWNRSFSIDKNFTLTVTDTESCFDTEKEDIVDEKTIVWKYQIQENGRILEIKEKAL